MRSNLIAAVAAASVMLAAGTAFADNSWAFDDPYWKQPETVGSVQPTQSSEVLGKYHHVDGYNP